MALRKESKSVSVVDIDLRLLHEAQRLITGANVHRMKGLIFAYELSVALHNDGFYAHRSRAYDPSAEVELRRAILQYRIEEFNSNLVAVAKNFAAIRGTFNF